MKSLHHILVATNLLSTILACGMSTHIEINYRALHLLNYTNSEGTKKLFDILDGNLGSWQAGSFFPDWGFGCSGYHNESEEAHWPIFHKTYIEIIRTDYADKLSELQSTSAHDFKKIRGNSEFKKNLGFLFGLIGHGVADVLFHDLDHREQGLIRAFANLNHNHDYYRTHQIADFGGELVLSHRYKLDYYSSLWQTPIQNLLKTYKRMGYSKPNSFILNSCMSLGYLAAQSNAKEGRLLFGKFELDKSAVMIQDFEDYFKGGLTSMSFKVYECWLELIDILLNNSEFENFCKFIFPDYAGLKQDKLIVGGRTNWTEFNSKLIEGSNDDDDGDRETDRVNKGCTKLNEDKGLLRIRSIYGNQNYEQFGTALMSGDFNNDGFKDLVISSPRHFNQKLDTNPAQYSIGKVEIYSGGKNILKLHQSPQIKLNAPLSYNSNQQFGKSLAVLDFNGDGIDDLIVGGPNYEPSKSLGDEYSGSINIYLGNSNWDLITNRPPITLPLPKLLKYRNYTQFGSNLYSFDINSDNKKDLIVGLPYSTNLKGKHLQSGIICAYLNSPKGIKDYQPSWCLESPRTKSYERFGQHIAKKILFDNRTSLLVGAPSYHSKDRNMMGRIYEIELDTEGFPNGNQKILLEGFEDNMQIGRSFDVDNSFPSQFMLVSASSQDVSTPLIKHWQAGKLYKFDFIQNQLELISKGFENGGQFGTQVKFHQRSNSWWATEPGRDGEKGGIYRINPISPSDSSCLEPITELGRFGTSIFLEDFDGDGIEDLVISEPLYSSYLDKRKSTDLRSEGRIQILFSVPKKLPLNFLDRYFYFKDFYYMGVSVTFWSMGLFLGLVISLYKLKFSGNSGGIIIREHNN